MSAQKMDEEIFSLASSIKKNMIDPADRRIEELEQRLSGTEKHIIFLSKAFLAASIILAITIGTVLYYLATN